MCLIEMLQNKANERKRCVAEERRWEMGQEESERVRIGASLREFRLAINVSVQNIAERMGVSVGRVERLESGVDCKEWNLLVKSCEMALTLCLSAGYSAVLTSENWRRYVQVQRRGGRRVI